MYTTIRSLKIILAVIILCPALFGQNIREMESLRGYYSKTYYNDQDSTFTTSISSNLIHYKDEKGDYQPIQTKIVQSTKEGYAYEVTRGVYHAYFKSDISDQYPVKFERQHQYVFQIQPYVIGYIDLSTNSKKVLAQVQSNQPVIRNNQITYPSIFPGVHLTYRYLEKKLKEEIILTNGFRNNLPPPSQFGLDNNTTLLVISNKIDFSSGLELEEQDSTGISNVLQLASLDNYSAKRRLKFKIRNKIKFMLPIDVAYLQQEDSTTVNEVVKLRRRIKRINGDLNLLTGIKYNKLLEFPAGNVVLDPTIETEFSGPDESEDTWLETTANKGSQTIFLVSKAKYYPLKRSIIKFDLSSIPSNAQIQSADFSGYYYAYGGSGAYWVTRFVEVHRLTRDWEEMEADRDEAENGVDWTGQLAEGDYDDDAGDPGVSITTINDYGWKEFDVADIVQLWADGSESNYGLLLRTAQENDGCDLRFRSSEYGTASYRPKLEITYKREFNKYYYLKDHLGNIRVTIDGTGNVKGYDDYYPFGLQMPGRSNNTANPNDLFKFSGKELDEENNLDWYYFGARYYDPAIGRWLSVDPKADKYPSLSPYVYVANNPLMFIDPNGEELKSVKMVGLTGSDPVLKERTYYVDKKIADKVVNFVKAVRKKFSKLSVNNTFRLKASSTIKTSNTKAKGLSRHQAGFAIDLNGVSKLSAEQLKELNKIAKENGLAPLKNQEKDKPHFTADPTDHD